MRNEVLFLNLPRLAAQPRFRPPIASIPQTLQEREYLLGRVKAHIRQKQPVPPVSLEELKEHAGLLLQAAGLSLDYLNYTIVLVSNEIWREAMAEVPFHRRLLLLPKCLRDDRHCPASIDELGLLCRGCGRCCIHELQTEAIRLGYAVLVAEGSAVVTSLIQTGQIDAIIGVGCLSVLERSFPYMESASVPGLGIPLLQDDCANTTVDQDWLWDAIHLTREDLSRRLDLSALRQTVETWFQPESLDRIMGAAVGSTEEVARQWLLIGGKRWRPFLTVAVFQALRGRVDPELPEALQQIAVAVECFHKASLIHDDIEDEELTRYGEKTVHAEHGLAFALNVGDLLIGEGYRLIAECGLPGSRRARMAAAAARGQRQLCLGQGAELAWRRNPQPLKVLDVIHIFRQKTAPAFEVALQLGALCAGSCHSFARILTAYSQALGIAYQIRDDLEDWGGRSESNDLLSLRPSLLMAQAYERAAPADQVFLQQAWRQPRLDAEELARLESLYATTGVLERGGRWLEAYQQEAVQSLRFLKNPTLKGLLRRVITKILKGPEFQGWCHELEKRNVADRPTERPAAG